MKRSTLEFHPIANVGDEGPIEFYFPPSDEDHLDLNSHTLELWCKIVNCDGSDLKVDAKVGFVNYPLHAMFSQMDVYLNENS